MCRTRAAVVWGSNAEQGTDVDFEVAGGDGGAGGGGSGGTGGEARGEGGAGSDMDGGVAGEAGGSSVRLRLLADAASAVEMRVCLWQRVETHH